MNPGAPNGIVSFELAGTPLKAVPILASWDATSQLFYFDKVSDADEDEVRRL